LLEYNAAVVGLSGKTTLCVLFDVVWQIQGFVSQIQTIFILFLGEVKVRWTELLR